MTQSPICFAVSSTLTLNAFLIGHLRALREEFRVWVAFNPAEGPAAAPPPGVSLAPIPIVRQVSPLRDLAALWRLWRLFRRHRFASVHSITPKAGLLAMTAARFAGVRVRLHTFTGQVWATRHGMARTVLKAADRTIAGLATQVFADSASQRDFLVSEGIVRATKITVLGHGSISGVDCARFIPDPATRSVVRSELGVGDDDVLLLFVGRLKREKGIPELLEAFSRLRVDHPRLHLVLVGPDEDRLLNHEPSGVRAIGYSASVERYMASADVLCLPSHREGFGSVIIEAACCGLPAVASRIYGLTDAVVDDVTGLLHAPGNATAIQEAIATLLDDPERRLRMGAAARERALRDFDASRVTDAWMHFYRSKLR